MTNLDYKVIKEGQEVEAMIETPGWVHVNRYIHGKMDRIANTLCNAEMTDIQEVIKLQAEYGALKGVFNKINRMISDYHRELEKKVEG